MAITLDAPVGGLDGADVEFAWSSDVGCDSPGLTVTGSDGTTYVSHIGAYQAGAMSASYLATGLPVDGSTLTVDLECGPDAPAQFAVAAYDESSAGFTGEVQLVAEDRQMISEMSTTAANGVEVAMVATLIVSFIGGALMGSRR